MLGIANKTMHKTLPALRSFYIIARHNGFGGFAGCVLPVRARAGLVIVGVSKLLQYHKNASDSMFLSILEIIVACFRADGAG